MANSITSGQGAVNQTAINDAQTKLVADVKSGKPQSTQLADAGALLKAQGVQDDYVSGKKNSTNAPDELGRIDTLLKTNGASSDQIKDFRKMIAAHGGSGLAFREFFGTKETDQSLGSHLTKQAEDLSQKDK